MILKPFKLCTKNTISQGYHQFHRALDFFPPGRNFSVYAPLVTPERVKIGKVYGNSPVTESTTEFVNGYGLWMEGLETGLKYLYWHTMPIILATQGEILEKGTIVAWVWNSGNVISGGQNVSLERRMEDYKRIMEEYATTGTTQDVILPGTHLHYVLVDLLGNCIDPTPLIDWETEPTYTYFDYLKAYAKMLSIALKLKKQ